MTSKAADTTASGATASDTSSSAGAAAEPDLGEAAALLRLAIVRTARRLRQEAAGEGGTDLTPTAAASLATVERHGPLSPSELAEIERVKRPTATRAIRSLCDAGLVTRTPDPTDGRSAQVQITAEGRARLRRLRGRKNAYLARIMRDLPPDDRQALERAAEVLGGLLERPQGSAKS